MRTSLSAFAVLAVLLGGASANSAPSVHAGSPQVPRHVVATLRTLDRGMRAVQAIEAQLGSLETYDPRAADSDALRERFFEAVLECGRAERALRTSAGQNAATSSDPLRVIWQASESLTGFTSSVRWLHRTVVMRADVGPAVERVRGRADAARSAMVRARDALTAPDADGHLQ